LLGSAASNPLPELGLEATCPDDRPIAGGPGDAPDSRGVVLAKG